MKKTILYSLIFLVLAGIPAALYSLGYIQVGAPESGEESETEEAAARPQREPDPIYLALDPPFVVNFSHRGTLRYLQVSLEVMYRTQELIDKIEQQMPAIRHELILLFSGQEFEDLNSTAGKEKLQRDVHAAINRLIEVEENAQDTGKVYITNFVMQ